MLIILIVELPHYYIIFFLNSYICNQGFKILWIFNSYSGSVLKKTKFIYDYVHRGIIDYVVHGFMLCILYS